MEDLAGFFFPRQQTWCQDWRIWSTVRQGRVVQSRTDYILGSNRQMFHNVAVRDPRNNSYHFMVVGCLHGASPREPSCYLGCRTCLPLRLPGRQTITRAEKLFAELRCAVPKPDKRIAHHKSWISTETWRLVNERVSTRRDPGRYQRRLRRLGRAIRALIKEDRRRRVTKEGEEVERLMTGYPPLPHRYWRRMRGCYREAVYHAPLPSQITLERITVECEKLYRAVPPHPRGRLFPHTCRPPQSTTLYLQMRRLSGRYGDYRVNGWESPPGCAPSTFRSGFGGGGGGGD